MADKLDPILEQLADEAAQGVVEGGAEVSVLIALRHAPGAEEARRLESSGLKIGSTVGDILTGRVAISNLEQLAADPLVISVEGSRPLEPEAP